MIMVAPPIHAPSANDREHPVPQQRTAYIGGSDNSLREKIYDAEKRPYHARSAHLTGSDAFHRVW